jgi:hypothetical protein
MTNIELYFSMNEQRISMNQLKILLALQHISEDAQQWKENEKTDLDDDTNVDKQWNDWTGFKTRFLKNWEEIDSPGNTFSELLKLNKRKFTTGKKRLSIIKYTERFKELIRKAGITDGNAIYQYSLGLTTDKYRSIALTNPTTLQGWYDAALPTDFSTSTVVWEISIRIPDQNGIWMWTLSWLTLYQEKKGNDMFGTTYASYVTRTDIYLKNVRTGSRTKEDLSQESTRENTRKESDSQKDIIFEPQKWMTVPMKKKMSQNLANQTKNK